MKNTVGIKFSRNILLASFLLIASLVVVTSGLFSTTNIVLQLSLAVVTTLSATYVLMHPKFTKKFIPTAPPQHLAFIRIIVGISALIYIVFRKFANQGIFSEDIVLSMGVMDLFMLLPGFEYYANSYVLLVLTKAVLIISLCFVIAGLFTRTSLIISTVLYLIVEGFVRQYSFYYHAGLVAIYFLTLLIFLPCGDAWSLDKYRRSKKHHVHSEEEYGFAVYACWLMYAMIVFMAGLSKIRFGGITWWEGWNIKRHILVSQTLHTGQFQWDISMFLIQFPVWFFSMIGILTMIVEITFILVLISRTARIIYPIVFSLFFVGIYLIQGFHFLDLILIATIFLNFRWFSKYSEPKKTTLRKHRSKYACIFSVVIFTMIFTWYAVISYYPFTPWHMHAVKMNNPTYYNQMVGHLENGEVISTEVPWFKELLDVSAFPRMHCEFRKFDPHCDEVFSLARDTYNTRFPENKIIAFEIMTYKWDVLGRTYHEPKLMQVHRFNMTN